MASARHHGCDQSRRIPKGESIITPMKFATDSSRLQCALWLDSLAQWEIALTLTFSKIKSTGDCRSTSGVIATTRHLIRSINRRCFGHGANRKGYCIASVYVIEYSRSGRHPHVHATLSIPPKYDFESMCRVITQKASGLHSIDRQIHLQHYSDFGWLDYCLKNGTENLVVEDIHQAKP